MDTTALPLPFKRVLALRRNWRLKSILSKVVTWDKMKVVDIGCGVDGRSFEDFIPENWCITGIDVLPGEHIRHTHKNFFYIKRNACDLSCFDDREFDLAVSIGMLEHVTDETTRKRIITETMRIAKQYVVVVPYKYGWIEPHYGVPFFPLIPYAMKVSIVKAFDLSGQRDVLLNDPEYINKNYCWLSNKQYKKLFPGSTIHISPTLDTIAITGRYCNG